MVMSLRAEPSLAPSSAERPAQIAQVAALCYRATADDSVDVLLVTSSRGRWILPKGWPMDDRSDAEAARQEAWEEAGVEVATLEHDAIGHYVGMKTFSNGAAVLCKNTVYALDVSRMSDDFPEKGARERRWVPFEEVADCVDDPDLARFLRLLQPNE